MSSYTPEEIKLINSSTTEFYKTVSESFSATRQHEWEGWRQCLQYFKDGNSVLDLGCGNCRFEKFLFENDINPEKIDCMDNLEFENSASCSDKVDRMNKFQIDIIDSLLNDNLNLKSYDVAVCFGVMHHVPSVDLREKLLKELSKSKIVIVSFWQFDKDERIFNKAQETTMVAQVKLDLKNLEENDYFLGWKDRSDVFRFCHNFTNEEIDMLSQNYQVVEKFQADNLNTYLVLSK